LPFCKSPIRDRRKVFARRLAQTKVGTIQRKGQSIIRFAIAASSSAPPSFEDGPQTSNRYKTAIGNCKSYKCQFFGKIERERANQRSAPGVLRVWPRL
jgi:hypothetical protein